MFNWNHNPSVYLLQWGCCNILPVHYQSSYGTLVVVMLCFDVLKNSDLFVVSWCTGISPLLLPYPLHRPRLQIACVLVFIFQWVVILDFMVLLSFGGMSIVRNFPVKNSTHFQDFTISLTCTWGLQIWMWNCDFTPDTYRHLHSVWRLFWRDL